MTLSLADQKKAADRRQAKRLKTDQWKLRNPNDHNIRELKQDGIKTVKIQNLLSNEWRLQK